MDSEKDILWNYYEEELRQGMKHETSRSSFTNLVLIATGVIITIVTYDKKINHNDWWLAIFLMIIGLFGVLCNLKYYERFHFHYSRAKGYRKLLESRFCTLDLEQTRIESDNSNRSRFKFMSRIRLYWLWIFLNLMISFFGLALIIKIIL